MRGRSALAERPFGLRVVLLSFDAGTTSWTANRVDFSSRTCLAGLAIASNGNRISAYLLSKLDSCQKQRLNVFDQPDAVQSTAAKGLRNARKSLFFIHQIAFDCRLRALGCSRAGGYTVCHYRGQRNHADGRPDNKFERRHIDSSRFKPIHGDGDSRRRDFDHRLPILGACDDGEDTPGMRAGGRPGDTCGGR